MVSLITAAQTLLEKSHLSCKSGFVGVSISECIGIFYIGESTLHVSFFASFINADIDLL